MVQQFTYNKESEIPPNIHKQIIEFLRTEWPDGFQGENKKRNWISKIDTHVQTFVLVEDDALISHVVVVSKNIQHKGVSYELYALTGMFTYAQFRNKKYGLQLLQSAMYFVRQSEADMVFIHSKLKGFYEKADIPLNLKVCTLVGDVKNPKVSDESTFTLFLSEKGKKGQRDFESKPFYFGKDLW